MSGISLDMSAFLGLVQTLATLVLYLAPIQVSTPLSTPDSEVMLFHEVWGRSLCRSLEKMVAVEQEYPGGVEHIFSPGCVPLQRCSGCCNDENLECFPTLTRNISMQLLRISPAQRTRQYVQLSFLEHHTCECRLKRNQVRQKLSSPHRRTRRRKGKEKKKGRKRKPRKEDSEQWQASQLEGTCPDPLSKHNVNYAPSENRQQADASGT